MPPLPSPGSAAPRRCGATSSTGSPVKDAGTPPCSPTATSASAATRSALLQRVRHLLAPGGRVVVELAEPGIGLVRGLGRPGGGRTTQPPLPLGHARRRRHLPHGRHRRLHRGRHPPARRPLGRRPHGGPVMTPQLKPPTPDTFTSRLRSPAVAARVGLWLGLSFGLCFVTGLVSHYAQLPSHPLPFPTSPSWGYRLTQGAPRRHRSRRGPAAAGQAVVGPAQALRGPAAARPPGAAADRRSSGAPSASSSPRRSSSSRPACSTRPSGTPGPPSPSAPSTTPSRGSPSAPCSSTSR